MADYVTRFTADVSQHDAAIKSTTATMNKFDKSVKNTQKDLGDMQGRLKGFGADLSKMGFEKLKGSLGGLGDLLTKNIGGALGKVSVAGAGASTSILGLSTAASAALPALAALGGAAAVIKKSMVFDTRQDFLQALTGLDDSGMKAVTKSALEMSNAYGIAAGEIMDSMGIIGSQYPELLKNAEGLAEVTDAANILAKAGGISVTEAATGITTVLNQMGVASSEAKNIMNTLLNIKILKT